MSVLRTPRRPVYAAARSSAASLLTCLRASLSTIPASGQHGSASPRAMLPTRTVRKYQSAASGTILQATRRSPTTSSRTTLRLGGEMPSCKLDKVAPYSTQALPAFCGTMIPSNIPSGRRATTVLVREMRFGAIRPILKVPQRSSPSPSCHPPPQDKILQMFLIIPHIPAMFSSTIPSRANFLLRTIPKSM